MRCEHFAAGRLRSRPGSASPAGCRVLPPARAAWFLWFGASPRSQPAARAAAKHVANRSSLPYSASEIFAIAFSSVIVQNPIIRKPLLDVKLDFLKLDFLTTTQVGGIMNDHVGNRLAQLLHIRQCAVWPFCVTEIIRACKSSWPTSVRRASRACRAVSRWPTRASATFAALAEPLDYPTLAQSTTPVDRVVLALDCGLPEVAHVTAAVVRCLADAGIDPDGVTVLQSPADFAIGADDPCGLVPDGLQERITRLTHDPDDRRATGLSGGRQGGRGDPGQPGPARGRRGVADRVPAR